MANLKNARALWQLRDGDKLRVLQSIERMVRGAASEPTLWSQASIAASRLNAQ
jgi:hypothetical protein